MFRRFRSIPPSVAAFLSFGVEALCLPQKRGGYEKAYRRRRFKLSAIPGPVMAAFHPSPWLIQNTNPLAAAGGSVATMKKTVRRQILNALQKGIVETDTMKARRRTRSIAKVMPSMEHFAGTADQN